MRKPGTYGPGRGEAPLCNMHNRYLQKGRCSECDHWESMARELAEALRRFVPEVPCDGRAGIHYPGPEDALARFDAMTKEQDHDRWESMAREAMNELYRIIGGGIIDEGTMEIAARVEAMTKEAAR